MSFNTARALLLAGALGCGAGLVGLIYTGSHEYVKQPPHELKRFYVIEEITKTVATDLSTHDPIYRTLQQELQELQSREGFEESRTNYEEAKNKTLRTALYSSGLALASLVPLGMGMSRRKKESRIKKEIELLG